MVTSRTAGALSGGETSTVKVTVSPRRRAVGARGDSDGNAGRRHHLDGDRRCGRVARGVGRRDHDGIGAGRGVGVRRRGLRGGAELQHAARRRRRWRRCGWRRASLRSDTVKETGCPAAGRAGAAAMEMAVAGSMVMETVPRTSPTEAVTSAAVVVDSVVRASPDRSLVTTRSRRRAGGSRRRRPGRSAADSVRRRARWRPVWSCRRPAAGWRARCGQVHGGHCRGADGHLDRLADGAAGIGEQVGDARLVTGGEDGAGPSPRRGAPREDVPSRASSRRRRRCRRGPACRPLR